MASAQDLPYLIQLLDDDDPEVQKAVCSGLKTMGGDISENLAAQGISLSKYKQRKVSQLLRGGRREELMEAWLTPSNGFSSLDHDWESLEHYLRLISDFLHDGITLRASLTDQLDILADELREELLIPSEQGVYDWMFGEGKFENREKAKAIDYDLCHVIESSIGSSASLAMVAMLLANRLGLSMSTVFHKEYFLLRYGIGEDAVLALPAPDSRKISLSEISMMKPALTKEFVERIHREMHLGDMLSQFLQVLTGCLQKEKRQEDVKLCHRLMASLTVSSPNS